MSRKIALNNNCQSNPSKSEGCEHNAKVPTTLGNIKYTWIPSMTQWPSTFTHFQFTVRHFHSFPSGRPRFGVVKLAPYLAFLRSKSWPRLTMVLWERSNIRLLFDVIVILHGTSWIFIPKIWSSWTLVYVGAVPLFEEILEIILFFPSKKPFLRLALGCNFILIKLRAETSPTFFDSINGEYRGKRFM